MVKIIDDTEIFEPFISPVCTYCDHLHREKGTKTCKAFPKGIPVIIWKGEDKHLIPFQGDQGLTFLLSPLVPLENKPSWIN